MRIPMALIFGLFVYLRQAGLSLHRSNLEALPFEIADYYHKNNIIRPEHLVFFLASLKNERRGNCSFIPDGSPLLKNYAKKHVLLRENEIVQIIKTLSNYSVFFKELEDYCDEDFKNQVRFSLANLAEKMEMKLPSDLINEGLKVEHFQQNECLQLLKFSDLLGHEWPNK